jgi:putative glutamine amidotransferase
MAPLIGITGRRLRTALVGGFDERFHDTFVDVYFADYARCVTAAGGIPVTLSADAATAALPRLDAVILTGGQDLNPASWNGPAGSASRHADPRRDPGAYDDERDAAEFALVRGALAHDVPLLGICRGTQVINAALGGSLEPHLGDSGPDAHDQPVAPPHDGPAWHRVHFVAGSRCADVYGPSRTTNSWHHQAVAEAGHGVVVTGRTSDGVVESIELRDHPCIGVQWHPEWAERPDPIFDWVVDVATARESLSAASR